MADSAPVEVRRILASDSSTLRYVRLRALEVDEDAFAASLKETLTRPEAHWSDRASESAHSDSKAEFLALDSEGIAVGLVGAYRFENKPAVAELVAMWIEPAFRGQGLSVRMVDAVLDWCARVEVRLVELWVTPGNHAATLLYERCGFVQRSPRDGANQYDGCDTYLSIDLTKGR